MNVTVPSTVSAGAVTSGGRLRSYVMTSRTLTATATAVAALAACGATAQAAQAPAFHLVGTPQLYTIDQPRAGGPSAYVVFAGDRHLHEPRSIVARVAGRSGRTYSVSDRCYRSAIVHETGQGGPLPVVKAGQRYTVTFSVRAGATGAKTTIATRRLVARTWTPSSTPGSLKTPRC